MSPDAIVLNNTFLQKVKLVLDHCVNSSVRDSNSVGKKMSPVDLSACEASEETVETWR